MISPSVYNYTECLRCKMQQNEEQSYKNEEFRMMREDTFERYYENEFFRLPCTNEQDEYKKRLKFIFMALQSDTIITQYVNHFVAFKAIKAMLDRDIQREKVKC